MIEDNKLDNLFKIPETEFSVDFYDNHDSYIDQLLNDESLKQDNANSEISFDNNKYINAGNLGGANIVQYENNIKAEQVASKEIANIIEYAKSLAEARMDYLNRKGF